MKSSWQRKTLGEVSTVDRSQGIHKKLPYVGLEHIESHTGRFIGSIEPVDVKSSTFKFSPKHLLYGRLRPYLNKVIAPDFEGHCSTEIFPILPNAGLMREFLQYWFLRPSTVSQIDATSTGARMPRANMNAITTLEFPLPPFPEQQRIVGILDKAFDAVAAAKANTEKNLKNSRALLESHLQSVFAAPTKGWITRPLAELCEANRVITYGVIKLGKEIPNGVPCLRTSNVRWLHIDTEGMKRIASSLSSEFSRTILHGGEVLVNVRGTLGGVAVVKPEMSGWNVSREVAVVPVDPAKVHPEFLSYLIGSAVSQKWLGGVKKGAAYVGINIEDLRLLPISAPKINEQLEIVRHLANLQMETERLRSIQRQKLGALESLKHSLLQQAFAGAL